MALKISCYGIGSFFRNEPVIVTCPVCASMLFKKEERETANVGDFRENASIPYIATTLFSCVVCRWWAVREMIMELECNALSDLIATCGFESLETKSELDVRAQLLLMYNNNPEPWQSVFDQKQLWENQKKLTLEQAVWLFGWKEVQDKMECLDDEG